MRALVMSAPSQGPELTRVEKLSEPRPAPGQVSIEVTHAGINFMDVMARRGDVGYASAWPYVPGMEVAGTVRELGDGVTGLAVGQRVAALIRSGGGLAEVAVAEASLTVPLPGAVASPVAAAAPLMLSTALLLLTDAARFRPGETVLMHSAGGGVGSAVAGLVPLLGGGSRIGVVGRANKVAGARDAGWDSVLVRGDDLAARAREVAGGGVDVILDPSGTGMLDVDLEVAAPGARIVLFGNAGGGRPEPLPALGRLIGGNVALAGFSFTRLAATAPQRVASALSRVLSLLADGQLALPVTEVGSLDEVPATHQLLAEGRGGGKYVARVAP
ncbi:zinc-binding dehydrogenase [Rugosimonospora acidiphila]|uniref:Zinc-binding dehydrogenase n=1 Tax=Rugosimonospora acidiphila TaxID=556531 RepID=A0ABP9SHN3_9ACTN